MLIRIFNVSLGVDIVLNSLAGDKLKSSVRALANNGRFLEIGKVDLAMNTPLGKTYRCNKCLML